MEDYEIYCMNQNIFLNIIQSLIFLDLTRKKQLEDEELEEQ